MRISNALIKPINTEKSLNLNKAGKVVFSVNMDASKGSIAKELKRAYGVDAVAVRTIVMPGTQRRVSRTSRETKKTKWKKAIVTLKEGQTIDLFVQK